MIHLCVLLFAYAGFSAICASMTKHQAETLGRKLAPRDQLKVRVAGWLALALSFTAAVVARGWKFGPVEWVWAICLSALVLVAWLMPWRPALVPRSAAGAAFAGAMLAVAAGLVAIA